MRDIGLEDFVLDIDKVSSDSLIEKFFFVVTEKEKIKNTLSLLRDRLHTERNEIVKSLKN